MLRYLLTVMNTETTHFAYLYLFLLDLILWHTLLLTSDFLKNRNLGDIVGLRKSSLVLYYIFKTIHNFSIVCIGGTGWVSLKTLQ